MENQNSLASLKEKYLEYEEDISREKVLKLILQNLVNRFSLEVIINDIISVTKSKENQLIIKDKNPLNSTDIISIIYKNVGSIKLFQTILDINSEPNEIPKSHKNSEKTTNYSNSPLNSPPNSSIEEENPQKSSPNISPNNNPNINNDNEGDNVVILIDNNQNEETINNNIIPLDENETINAKKKDGTKSELKKTKKIRKKNNNSINMSDPVHYYGINSETKLSKAHKKARTNYEQKLGFHYTLEKGNFYKYKIKNIVERNKTIIFVCDDIKCKGAGEYCIASKTFKAFKRHNVSFKNHSYIKKMVARDMNIFKYMKENSIEDMQLTKA